MTACLQDGMLSREVVMRLFLNMVFLDPNDVNNYWLVAKILLLGTVLKKILEKADF